MCKPQTSYSMIHMNKYMLRDGKKFSSVLTKNGLNCYQKLTIVIALTDAKTHICVCSLEP